MTAAPVRVLLIAPGNEILGGQTIQAIRLLEILGAMPDPLEIRFQPINPLFPAPLRWVKRVPFVRTMLTMALYLGALARHASWPDVFHIFTAGLSSYTLWTIPAMLFARLHGKRIIVNYRDGRGEDHLLRYRTAKPTLAWADVIVSPSGYIVDLFARHGLERGLVIPNVIDAGRFIDRRRARLAPRLMTNRSLEPLYNVPCILRAFARVRSRFPDASLVIAHEGPELAKLEALAASLGVRDAVSFIGKVPPAEVPRLYDACDVYITLPDIDCMPGSILEALASGVPVVATRTGGIPYLVRDGEQALLVDLDDDSAAAAAIMRLLEDPELVERLTAAGRRELAKYTPEAVGGVWLRLYQDLVNRRS